MRWLLLLVALASPAPFLVASPPDDDGDDDLQLLLVDGELKHHNVLVVLADDLGIDTLFRYLNDPLVPGGATVPQDLTPNIDELMDKGVRFTNAWANPLCSPTRATIQTGKYGFQTGIGHVIEQGSVSLTEDEVMLSELLLNSTPGMTYRVAAYGKWHLQANPSVRSCAPVCVHDYEEFEGSMSAIALPTCSWPQNLCASCTTPGTAPSSQYMPRVIMEAARSWIASIPSNERFFCYLAPQTPFEFPHLPPADLQTHIPGSTTECDACPGGSTVRDCYDAQLQALDTKIGDILGDFPNGWEKKMTVIFVGDNGTPGGGISFFPHPPPAKQVNKAKGSLFEGGVHVPLIIAGTAVHPDRRGSECDALVNTTDIYRTVAKLAGVPGSAMPAGLNSANLKPLLRKIPGPDPRTHVFAEKFSPNGTAPTSHVATIRDATFKLMWDCKAGVATHLFDLGMDPDESVNLKNDPAYATVLAGLRTEICNLMTTCACGP